MNKNKTIKLGEIVSYKSNLEEINCEFEPSIAKNTGKHFFDYWNKQVTLDDITHKPSWITEYLKPIDPYR